MTLTRWKLTAGGLAVSLGGLAAVAGAQSRPVPGGRCYPPIGDPVRYHPPVVLAVGCQAPAPMIEVPPAIPASLPAIPPAVPPAPVVAAVPAPKDAPPVVVSPADAPAVPKIAPDKGPVPTPPAVNPVVPAAASEPPTPAPALAPPPAPVGPAAVPAFTEAPAAVVPAPAVSTSPPPAPVKQPPVAEFKQPPAADPPAAAPPAGAPAAGPDRKVKVVLHLGDDRPRFEVRDGEDVCLKVTCDKLDAKAAADVRDGTGTLRATGMVVFHTPNGEGTCRELTVAAGTGQVAVVGAVGFKYNFGKAETSVTGDRMTFVLGAAKFAVTTDGAGAVTAVEHRR